MNLISNYSSRGAQSFCCELNLDVVKGLNRMIYVFRKNLKLTLLSAFQTIHQSYADVTMIPVVKVATVKLHQLVISASVKLVMSTRLGSALYSFLRLMVELKNDFYF